MNPTESPSPHGCSRSIAVRTGSCVLATLLLALTLGSGSMAQDSENKPAGSKLNLGNLRVFQVDQPMTGSYRFEDPESGDLLAIEIREEKPGSRRLVGVMAPDDREVLTLAPLKNGVGYEGTLRYIFSFCGQHRVPVTDLLPLGDQLVIRVDADPPASPCPYLENPENARLIVAPAPRPVRLLGLGDISSAKTREQIGLDGQVRSGGGTPILASTVLVEGGTELKFVGRTRGLDGSIWIEVETLVSPAPGVDPPRGYVRPGQVRVAATITLRRVTPMTSKTPG
jgi:hypothetical protein